jgi:hypothetical protein
LRGKINLSLLTDVQEQTFNKEHFKNIAEILLKVALNTKNKK